MYTFLRYYNIHGFIQWRGEGEASLPEHPASPPLPKRKDREKEKREENRERREREREREREERYMVGERGSVYFFGAAIIL